MVYLHHDLFNQVLLGSNLDCVQLFCNYCCSRLMFSSTLLLYIDVQVFLQNRANWPQQAHTTCVFVDAVQLQLCIANTTPAVAEIPMAQSRKHLRSSISWLSVTVTNTWEDQLIKKQGLLGLKAFEIPDHDWLALLLSAHDRMKLLTGKWKKSGWRPTIPYRSFLNDLKSSLWAPSPWGSSLPITPHCGPHLLIRSFWEKLQI